MCEFVAVAIPKPTSGGRLGPGLWASLMERSGVSSRSTCPHLLLIRRNQHPGLSWANRHTAQSWQEHYKKNRERLDAIVAEIVKENPPPADGKGLYMYSRDRTRRNLQLVEEEELIEQEEVEEVEELVTPRRARRRDAEAQRRSRSEASQVEQGRNTRHASDLDAKQFGKRRPFNPPSDKEQQDDDELPVLTQGLKGRHALKELSEDEFAGVDEGGDLELIDREDEASWPSDWECVTIQCLPILELIDIHLAEGLQLSRNRRRKCAPDLKMQGHRRGDAFLNVTTSVIHRHCAPRLRDSSNGALYSP